MRLDAAELRLLQDAQVSREKKLIDLQQMTESLKIYQKEMNRHYAENLKSLEILKESLKISDTRLTHQQRDFDELDVRYQEIQKEKIKLAVKEQELENENEKLNRKIIESFTVIQDQKQTIIISETRIVELSKELDSTKITNLKLQNEIKEFKKVIDKLQLRNEPIEQFAAKSVSEETENLEKAQKTLTVQAKSKML